MSAADGRELGGWEHVRQSIRDILTTPLGSRVMRPEYGSRLPDLVDAPLDGETVMYMYAATASALQRWEPRFALKRVAVRLDTNRPGKVSILVFGRHVSSGQSIAERVPL